MFQLLSLLFIMWQAKAAAGLDCAGFYNIVHGELLLEGKIYSDSPFPSISFM